MNTKKLLHSTALAMALGASPVLYPAGVLHTTAHAQETGDTTNANTDGAELTRKEQKKLRKQQEAEQKAAEEAAAAAEAEQKAAEEAAAAAAQAEQKAAEEAAAAAAQAGQKATEEAAAAAAAQAEQEAADEGDVSEEDAAQKTGGETEPEQDSAGAPPESNTAEESTPPSTDENGQQTAEQPPAPSPEAPVANEMAEEPIEEQIEEAEETAVVVVPEDISAENREKLKKAEKRRRENARERRQELIGAAAVGVAVGALLPALGGRVVEDEGDRFVVERNGQYFVRKDDSALFRHRARDVTYENLPRGRTLETVYRPNGSRIETVRDPGGYVLRRSKFTPNGREIVLYDFRDVDDRRTVNYDRTLPPIQLTIPRDEYIVSGSRYDRRSLAEIFAAPPVEEIRNDYTLRDVRENNRVRDIVRRVDLDTINFDSGSFTVSRSQIPYLAEVAGAMLDEIENNPGAVFLIEGHTDAVGGDVYNLTLSDRRAETVARILSEAYDVPPENLVTQGYGEQYLKVDTQGDERRNRRVTVRNITPLLTASSD